MKFNMNISGNPRPLSPHLQIYKPQLTSVMSIFHRFTGVGLIAGVILLCIWLFCLVLGEKYYTLFLNLMINPLAKLVTFSIIACCYYHFFNGIRYLMWSLGKCYDLVRVYRSGWTVLLVVFLLMILTVYFI